MAAPTFIAASGAGTNTASNTVTCNYPAGSANGDLLVMFAGFQRSPASGTQTLATPSGWTLLDTQQNSSTYGQVSATYWRFRGAETSVSVVASNSTSQYGTVQIHAYSAATVDSTTPISVSAIQAQSSPTGSTAARPCPSVTTPSVDNAISCFAAIASLSSGRTFTWGITERIDAYTGTNADLYYTSATTTAASAGATGVFNITPSAGVDELHTATVAVQPPQMATINDTDTGAATSETATVIANSPVTDSGAATAETAQVRVAASDTRPPVTETAQVLANSPVTDSGQGGETASVVANTPAADSGSFSESAYVINLAVVTDSAQGTETASVSIIVNDLATFTEVQAGIGQETGGFGENQTIIITVSDAISSSDDAFSANAAFGNDTANALEQANITVRGTDSGQETESASVTANSPVADSGQSGETQRVTIYATDGGTATEGQAIRVRATDSAQGVDSASVVVTIFATDGGSATDSTTTVAGTTDSGTFTENAFRLISGLLVFPRQVKIQADNRRIIIDREPRRVSIDPDYRRTSIRAEVRRHIVIPKDKRVFEIEGE